MDIYRNMFDKYEKRNHVKETLMRTKEEIIYRNRRNKNNFLNFENAGTTFSNKNFRAHYDNELNRHTSFEYVISGKMIIEKDGVKYDVNPGDTYILKSGYDADYYSKDDEKISKIWFSVRGELLDGLLKLYKLTDSVIIISCDTQRIIEDIHTLLMSNVDSPYITQKLSMCLYELILKLSFAKESVDTSFDPGSSIADQLKSYVDCRLNFEYSLKTFASMFHTNEKHLISVFKKKYGITPYAYLTQNRIEFAKELLETTSLTVKEIASKLYYSSASNFSLAFKKHTGMYPSEYRQKKVLSH